MRDYITIIEAAFGSEVLSRITDPTEEITFKVFALPQGVEAVRAILAKADVLVDERPANKLFLKVTFTCSGTRQEAEAVARAVKMSRIEGAVTRID